LAERLEKARVDYDKRFVEKLTTQRRIVDKFLLENAVVQEFLNQSSDEEALERRRFAEMFFGRFL
jgi:hypothetical protein